MPKLPIIDSLLQRGKHSIPSDALKVGPAFNFGEGELVVLTYTPAADKMKVFSKFTREGLENGDAVFYVYPDEESETVRAKLKEHGVDMEKYEKDGALRMKTLSEVFKTNGKLDYEKAIIDGLNWWAEAKEKGYKHVRDISDLGDFSFINGQLQKWITDYWLDPRWADPNISEWAGPKRAVGPLYEHFIMEIAAINVESMTTPQVNELLKAFGKGSFARARFLDLLEHANDFSRLIGLNHERLVGREILLEIDPASDYEKVFDSLVKESMANVEPFFVFTSRTSSLHTHLANRPATKFFLTSLSTSAPESTSENTVLLPAKNTSLILESVDKTLEIYADTNVCFIFNILPDLLISVGPEKTLNFARRALDILSPKKVTSIFLLNTTAHELQVVSQIRDLFANLLTHDKDGLKVVKTS